MTKGKYRVFWRKERNDDNGFSKTHTNIEIIEGDNYSTAQAVIDDLFPPLDRKVGYSSYTWDGRWQVITATEGLLVLVDYSKDLTFEQSTNNDKPPFISVPKSKSNYFKRISDNQKADLKLMRERRSEGLCVSRGSSDDIEKIGSRPLCKQCRANLNLSSLGRRK